jgi:hypothetical protein
MLAQPGLGECPPLRMANSTWNCTMMRRTADRSWAEVGRTTQDGAAQHVSDLHIEAGS